MKTIRRLYFYAIAFISIEVVLWGLIGLLRSILSGSAIDSASALARALSLILVGVPIFLIHWLWAQRAAAKDDEEKSATLRAVFLYGILLGTLIPVAQNALALINRAFLAGAGLYASGAVVGGAQIWTDNLVAIAINLLIAAYFWNVLQGEWRSLLEKENFVEVRRLARFIWMLYGLLFSIYGAQQALHYAFVLSPADMLGEAGRDTAINAIALMLVGAPIWLFAWNFLQAALNDSSEQESLLRLGVLYLLSLGGVTTVLTAGGNFLYLVLLQLFGAGKGFAEFFRSLGAPVSIGVPFAVVWAYYGRWLNRQFAFDADALRREAKRRLYFYLLSLLGLVATAFALMSLVSLALDLITAQSYLAAGGFADPLARALAFLIAGLPLWLWTWRPVQALALEDSALGDHARRSVIRKTYLYLVLFASVIGVMVSAGGLIFMFINAALGGETNDLLNSALNALQVLVIFAALLLYHLSTLRKDGKLRADDLEAKQKGFHVAVIDHDGQFGAAFAKYVSNLSVQIVNAKDLPDDFSSDAVVFSSALWAGEENQLAGRLRSLSGIKLPVQEDVAGVFWARGFAQAADYARTLAEGGQIRPQPPKGASAWMALVYIAAALFALEFCVGLLIFAVSLANGF
ncbi:MAG: hypothetical protein Fur002_10920 [Anaerolineales bacterium]